MLIREPICHRGSTPAGKIATPSGSLQKEYSRGRFFYPSWLRRLYNRYLKKCKVRTMLFALRRCVIDDFDIDVYSCWLSHNPVDVNFVAISSFSVIRPEHPMYIGLLSILKYDRDTVILYRLMLILVARYLNFSCQCTLSKQNRGSYLLKIL